MQRINKFVLGRKLRERTWKVLNGIVAVVTVLNVSMVGSLVAPQAANASIGSISIDVSRVSGNTYKASGLWEPQGAQCWTPGSGFHYRVGVTVDGNNIAMNPAVDPAACNEDYTSDVDSDNRSLGGHWPAIAADTNGNVAQPDVTFYLGNAGEHQVCAELRHVSEQGEDRVDATACTTVNNSSDITVNKWLWNGQSWVMDNDAANNLGFMWGIGDYDTSTNRAFGTQATDYELTTWYIRENTVSGYHTVGWFVDQGSCENPTGSSEVFLINLEAPTYTVNFCNAPDEPTTGTLVVHKQADTDGNGSYETTVTDFEGGFGWQATGVTCDQGMDEWCMFGTSKELAADTYTVTEKSVSGYEEVGWVYGNPDGDICADTKMNVGDAEDLDIVAGEETHITFCNKVLAPTTLTVHKSLNSGDGFVNIDETANDMGFHWGLSHADGLDLVSEWGTPTNLGTNNVNDGVTEVVPDGYTFLGWYYGDEGDCSGELNNPGSNVSIEAGQNGVITICNQKNRQPKGSLTVIKNFYDFGWSQSPSRTNPEGWTWDITDGQQNIAGGTEVWLSPDTYEVSEDAIDNYFSYWQCYDTSDGMSFISSGATTKLSVEVHDKENVTCWFTNVAKPALIITKTDHRDAANPGDVLTYEVTVTNTSSAPAFNVKVTDALPGFVGAPFDISDFGFDTGAGYVIWTNLMIPGNGSKTVTFKATVNSSLPNGTTVIKNVATLGCSPFVDSRTLSLTTFVDEDCQYSGEAIDNTLVTLIPSIDVDKTGPSSATAGDNLSYTIAWSVGGAGTVANAIVTDVLPAGTTFVSADNGGTYDNGTNTVTWNLGNKVAGDNGIVGLVIKSSASAANGTLVTNTAHFDTNDTDAVDDSANTTLTAKLGQVLGATTTPNLTIAKSVNKSTAKPGDILTYTIVVTSTGDGDAENVVVKDTLPDDLSFVDFSGKSHSWNLGTMAPGESKTFTVKVRVESDAVKGEHVNVATAVADGVGQKQDSATVMISIPKVLGLATTGTSGLDYAVFLAGLFLLALGALGLMARQVKVVRVRK